MSVTETSSSSNSAAGNAASNVDRSLSEPAARAGRERGEVGEPAAKLRRRGSDFHQLLEQTERKHESGAIPRRVGGVDGSRDRRFARRDEDPDAAGTAGAPSETAAPRGRVSETAPTERTATPALEQIASEVVRGVEISRARGGTEVRLELNAGDLGLGSVKVGQDAKGRIAVEFSAISETGRRLVEDGAGSLLSALESRGLSVKSIAVASPGEGALDALRASGGRLGPTAAEAAQASAPSGDEPGRGGQGGEDRSRGFFRYSQDEGRR